MEQIPNQIRIHTACVTIIFLFLSRVALFHSPKHFSATIYLLEKHCLRICCWYCCDCWNSSKLFHWLHRQCVDLMILRRWQNGTHRVSIVSRAPLPRASHKCPLHHSPRIALIFSLNPVLSFILFIIRFYGTFRIVGYTQIICINNFCVQWACTKIVCLAWLYECMPTKCRVFSALYKLKSVEYIRRIEIKLWLLSNIVIQRLLQRCHRQDRFC